MLDVVDAHAGAANGVANGPHYGAGRVEYDVASALIIYEEYHPFGTSAYRAVDSTIEVSAKRYRYAAAERDEETGLDHMGIRYYAPWLGRWTSADPIGLGDGVNRYAYVHGNPVSMRDPGGTRTEGPEAPTIEQLRTQHEQWRQEVEAEESGKTPEVQPESPRTPDRQTSKPYTGPDPRGAEWIESARAEYQDFLGRMYDTAKTVEQSVSEARDTALMWTGAYAASLFGPVAALRIGASLAGSQGAAYAFATSEAELVALAMEASPLFTAGVLTAEATVGSPSPRGGTATAPKPTPPPAEKPKPPEFVFRGGSATPGNLTPRPGVDTQGLSTFDRLEAATKPGGKAQKIDLSKLVDPLVGVPDAPKGHVSIRPGVELNKEVLQQIETWAATRGTGKVHPFTQSILDAIVETVRRPK